jgi:hypothetical protein
MALVVVVAVAVGGFFVWRATTGGSVCDTLVTNVAGSDGWHDVNGITSYGPDWVGVLVQAPTNADQPSRAELAAAVAADGDGYESFRSALPEDLAPAADHLHAIVLDPDADGSGTKVEADARSIGRHVRDTCNIAL